MHEKFHYASLEELRAKAQELSAWLPLSEDLSVLERPLAIAGHTLPHRLVLQPMEGSDGTTDGAPGPLTIRRYQRFAAGGASLIWFEAVSTVPEGRASARQLMLTEDSLANFQRLVEQIKEIGLKENGFAPVVILQATHSGRYSKPRGAPEPLIAYNNPIFEETPLDASRIVSDDDLKQAEERFGTLAALGRRAGFDGMDVKACHRYLACELLSAYTRPGQYGGSFENRTRFLLNAYRAARAATPGDFLLTSRLNVYDGFAYPYGFGVAEGGSLQPELSEAKRLVGILKEEMKIPLLNITIGNPYKNPHVNRPYDNGVYVPQEHPLTGESRMMACVSEIQHAYRDLPVIGSAFSYLRQFSPNLAAGMISGGHAALAGFGRLAFACPDFPNRVLRQGTLDEASVCLTCGRCALFLRAGEPSGCAVRDETYRGKQP